MSSLLQESPAVQRSPFAFPYDPTPLDLDDPTECPIGEDGCPGEPLLPFADWIEMQASLVRLLGYPAAAWLAGKMDRLAADARFLDARSPDEFDARYELNEAWVKEMEMERALTDPFHD